MKSMTWSRVRSSTLVLSLALSLVLVPQLVRATPASASPALSTTLTVCGVVSGYTAATSSVAGTITINGGTPFPILKGTTFTGAAAASVANGANLCFVLTLDASNNITAAVVTPNTPSAPTLCGPVSGYLPAGTTPGSAQGSITIGALTFTIVPTTAFTGSGAAAVANGANLCFALTLNGAGQITAAVVSSNTPAYLTICGLISGFMPAGTAASGTNGTITVGGQLFTIVAGTTFSGPAGATVANGQTLCFQLTLNGANQIVAGTVTTTGTGAGTGTGTMQLCGMVTAFSPAGAGSTGTLSIAGQTFVIAAGTVVSGAVLYPGTSYCLIITFNGAGQIATVSVGQNLPGVSIVCGVFTSYTPAVGVVQAFLVIGGVVFPLNAAAFVPVTLVTYQVYCFLLSPTGVVIGLLSGVPTLATPFDTAGSTHHVGRLVAQ